MGLSFFPLFDVYPDIDSLIHWEILKKIAHTKFYVTTVAKDDPGISFSKHIKVKQINIPCF